MQTEFTHQEALEILGTFQLLDSTRPQFTPLVTSKFTSNQFEFSEAQEANDKYVEMVKTEFAKTIGQDLKPLAKGPTEKNPAFDLKSLQHAGQEVSEAFYEKFQEYLEKHEGYRDFLQKKIKIDVKPIYLKELEKCIYNSTILMLLKNKVIFKEKQTVKPSAN